MTLKRLANPAPSSEALLRIRQGRFTLNNKAAALLGIRDLSRVAFTYDEDSGIGESKRLFIGKVNDGGFRLTRRGETFFANSVEMCRKLAESLQGYGTYRIDGGYFEEDFYGNRQYNIFPFVYDK